MGTAIVIGLASGYVVLTVSGKNSVSAVILLVVSLIHGVYTLLGISQHTNITYKLEKCMEKICGLSADAVRVENCSDNSFVCYGGTIRRLV